MNTIIGASLTTRTDGLGTARYSDPVSGQGGGGSQGPQGWQGWLGDAGPQGDRGFQGPSGGGGGSQGPQGVQGWQGPQGWQGLQGWQGEAGPQGVGSGTIGTPPIIDSQVGTPGTADEGLKYDTKPGLLLAGNPAPLVTDEPMLQTPILVFLKTATGAVPKGLCLPLHGGLKPGPSEGVEVYPGKGIWVAQDISGESWGRTSLLRGEDAPTPFSSGLEFIGVGDAVKVKVKPTSGIILDTDGLSVKLETNGGILFNLAGELYTVWQPDPV